MSGVIAAGHPQTVEAGAEMLQQGGNAVDAAVAATFASFVAESSLVNIGGGGIAQVYDPGTRRSVVYDFFSTMPGLSTNHETPEHRLDFRKVSVDFGAAQQPFYIGRGSVAVPGVVAGLCRMAEEMGTLPLPRILDPSVRLAREGVILSGTHAYITHLLKPILTDTPQLAAIYAPTGEMLSAGQTITFPELADTLEALGREGPSLFYTGVMAEKILADQQAHGGLITEADLASYRVVRSVPIPVAYRGYTVLLPPPSSAGGPLIAFALKLLASLSLEGVSHNGLRHLRILAEIMRLTNVARAAWEVTLDQQHPATNGHHIPATGDLLADDNVRDYRQKLSETLNGQQQSLEPKVSKEPSNTTHISVADESGRIVAITTSAGESAGFLVGDTGVALNNMLGEIDLHPGGFHRLPPGHRLMTMMSPTLVLHDGRPVMAIGSGGSNRLRSAILQTISNVIDFDLNLAEAVGASRLHFEADEAQLEGGIDPAVADQMESAGYKVNRWPGRNMFFGGAHAVARRDGEGNTNSPWMAVGDPRRGGSVASVKES